MLRDYLRRLYRVALPYLYAKKNYKFFLGSSFTELDLKAQRVVNATNLHSRIWNPIRVRPPFGKKALVVAPHQDDEAIGCGGSVLAHVDAGGEVKVVIVHEGSGDAEALGRTKEEMRDLREGESASCASLAGLGSPTFLRCPALDQAGIDYSAGRLREIIAEYRPDVIFSPSVFDHHQDHVNTSIALADALEGNSSKIEVYSYEIWGLTIPNVAVFIDDYINLKDEMIGCFKSQTNSNDYAHAFRGLAMYHSLQFGARDTKYVERFFVQPREEFVEYIKKVTG